MLYWKTTETILISGMVLKKTSKNHCSLLQVFTCVGTVARISKKTLPMKRWRAATRQDYTQCCDWCLRGRQSLAGGNPTARWSRYSSLLAVTWPKHTETTFDLCPKWLDNHTKVSRLTLFISLNKNHHFFLEAPHNNHFKIAYSAIRWCLRLDSIPPSAPAEQNGL